MHGLGPNVPPVPHDHGAALDAASHGQYHMPSASPQSTPNSNPGSKLIHSLVDVLSNRVVSNPSSEAASFNSLPSSSSGSGSGTLERMPDVSDLVELKSRLCLREG